MRRREPARAALAAAPTCRPHPSTTKIFPSRILKVAAFLPPLSLLEETRVRVRELRIRARFQAAQFRWRRNRTAFERDREEILERVAQLAERDSHVMLRERIEFR